MMMKKEVIIILITTILVILPILWVIQHSDANNSDLKKYDVYSIETKKIDNKNVSIVYQIKNPSPYEHLNNIDSKTKAEICYITWYMFNHYHNIDEVQIIAYYNDTGKLKEYYKFKIDRNAAEISGLLNISDADISSNMYYYYRKIIKLGVLKVKDVNIPYWRRVYGYNNTNQ
ncbi:hypothetical protein [Methanothermococcus okinawensis]|uniref:Uncharacterized protein n=1 Tax=Methanothermococcus okinawensis (strain DSM 14208 / JCM 11175 / IH1) TaxID=647113 RepID=F8ALZ6_METOI|nr:hypothetical protein [Methanothermococcus okinawensis]AEH06671.1 hypothetical protein Metok_0694 [Methanothermococcus okinawensis IH1]